MKRLLLYFLFINIFCFGLCFVVISFSLVVYGWSFFAFLKYILLNPRFYFLIVGGVGLLIMQIKR